MSKIFPIVPTVPALIAEPEHIPQDDSGSGFNYNEMKPADANRVRSAARRIRDHLKRSVIDIGRELEAIKPFIPHGKFSDWVRLEFRMENRTAQRYMSVATSFGDDCDRVSYLPPTILFDLSGKKPHHIEARSRLLARIDAGGRPGEKEVRDIIRTAKPPKPRSKPAEPMDPAEPLDASWSDAKPSAAVRRDAEAMARRIVEALPLDAKAIADILKDGGSATLADSIHWFLNESCDFQCYTPATRLPRQDLYAASEIAKYRF